MIHNFNRCNIFLRSSFFKFFILARYLTLFVFFYLCVFLLWDSCSGRFTWTYICCRCSSVDFETISYTQGVLSTLWSSILLKISSLSRSYASLPLKRLDKYFGISVLFNCRRFVFAMRTSSSYYWSPNFSDQI